MNPARRPARSATVALATVVRNVLIHLGKLGLVILAGLAAGAAGFWLAFGVTFLACRAVVWITGDMQQMFWMWLVVPLGGITGLSGFFTGAVLCAVFLYKNAIAGAAFPLEPERST